MDAPAVAVSRDGKKIAVAWMDERTGGNKRQVYWTVLEKGGFARETRLAADPNGAKGHPSLSIDAEGVVHAAWEDARTGTMRIHHRSSSEGKDVALSPDIRALPATFPSLACGKITGVAFDHGDNVVFSSPSK